MRSSIRPVGLAWVPGPPSRLQGLLRIPLVDANVRSMRRGLGARRERVRSGREKGRSPAGLRVGALARSALVAHERSGELECVGWSRPQTPGAGSGAAETGRGGRAGGRAGEEGKAPAVEEPPSPDTP